MPPADALVPFILAAFLISLAPGPDNLFVLTQSALYGGRSGVLITLGLCSGLLVHTTAVALGIAALVRDSGPAFLALKLAGALYLLYLAWLAFKAPAILLQGHGSTLQPAWALYRRGILMNVSNPKVAVFFLAFLPQFTASQHGPLVTQFFILGTLFIAVALLTFCTIALLAGALSRRLQRRPRVQLILNRLAGGLFVLLAFRLVLFGEAAARAA